MGDGGSSPEDSVVVHSLGGPLNRLLLSLQTFVVHRSTAAVPRGDAAGQDALSSILGSLYV